MADIITQHPPAMKVGGRRLSLPSRPRPLPPTNEPKSPRSATTDDAPADYPRPAAPEEHPHAHHQQEEEVPPKRKQTGSDEHERRLQESLYRKQEQNRPKKAFQSGPKAVGAGGRISQPAGKTLGA